MMTLHRPLFVCVVLFLFALAAFPQKSAPHLNEESLYFKALSASIIAMEKSWGEQKGRDFEVRTDYHHVLVERDPTITDDLPNQFGDHRIEYLDTQDVVARCKQLRKPFAIMKISPIKNEGEQLKITITVYWASYKKGRLGLGLSDWSMVELKYSCETQSFIISNVELGGV
jgi:hypothetical protein